MSDQKLRDLERRWKETGSPADEAAYLLERVRVGDLTRERLELAAYCGHVGARGTQPAGIEQLPLESVEAFIRGLANFGKEPVVAAAVIGALTVAELAPAACRGALESARQWLRCPCADHTHAARASSEEALFFVNALPANQSAEKCSGASMACSARAAALDDPFGPARIAVQMAANAAQGTYDRSPHGLLRTIRIALLHWSLTGEDAFTPE